MVRAVLIFLMRKVKMILWLWHSTWVDTGFSERHTAYIFRINFGTEDEPAHFSQTVVLA
jgi:hypothetical protein